MGGGSYSYIDSHSRSVNYSRRSREEVFTQRSMNEEMNICGTVREACDSTEHPLSFPIILALDVTGSMGEIPERLIKGIFPEIMRQIAEKGVQHAQVCFLGFGDHYTDHAPLQVGQFETSDSLLDKWLKLIWLEGHGGGNGGESPLLAWYFASRHTKCDHIIKRGGRGVLITISDERTHRSLSRAAVKRIFGDTLEKDDITVEQLLAELQGKWDVYHFCLQDFSCRMQKANEQWVEMLAETAYGFDEIKDLQDIIPQVIVQSYKTQAFPLSQVSAPASATPNVSAPINQTPDIIL